MNDINIVKCVCCDTDLKTNVFIPKEGNFKKNYLVNFDNIICFECLGFYLHETYLKNSNTSELNTIIKEIKNLKKGNHEEDFVENNTDLDGLLIDKDIN